MRHAFLATPVLSVLVAVAPAVLLSATAHAQTAPVEVRVDRLEKEMKAVQRKVFPGGTPIEADITRQPAPPVQTGTPASTPISDLISRVDALESQLATLTGQSEQNAYKIKQLEDAFARYKAEAAAATPAPPPTVPTQPTASAPPRPATPAPTSDARKAAVAVIEKPDTGDAPADAYTYGYRLWDAKFYPEAQAQLKATVDKYAANGVASRASNLLGRAYLDDGKPALASVAFYENYQKRPRGDRAADSLTWLGEALIQLKKPADACKVYGELEQVYGESLASNLRAMMEKGRTRAKCGA
ncbi:hypothetical protein BH10PSE12_BH10PSE12_14000 [soil metagenome]